MEPRPLTLDRERLITASQPTRSLEGSCDSSSADSPISNHGSTGVHIVSVPNLQKLSPTLNNHTSSTTQISEPRSCESSLYITNIFIKNIILITSIICKN